MSQGSTFVVYAALAGNLAIAATKLAASLFTGSSAMFTEAIHSFVDTGDQGLLLYGMKRAERPPDRMHPFGHGLELYFWSFVVALFIFALGGLYAIYEGIERIRHPEPIEKAWVNFAVIGASFVFEGISFVLAWREMRSRFARIPMWTALRRSKDPSTFTVVLEDGAALLGLAVALAGVSVSVAFEEYRADGVASIGIGLLLIGVAAFLAQETRSLLTGESASSAMQDKVQRLIEAEAAVDSIGEIKSLQLGPQTILMIITVALRDGLSVAEAGEILSGIAGRVREAVPHVRHLSLVPTSRPGSQEAAAS